MSESDSEPKRNKCFPNLTLENVVRWALYIVLAVIVLKYIWCEIFPSQACNYIFSDKGLLGTPTPVSPTILPRS
jgi:hypothetical protein